MKKSTSEDINPIWKKKIGWRILGSYRPCIFFFLFFPQCSRLQQLWKITLCRMQEPVMSLGCLPRITWISAFPIWSCFPLEHMVLRIWVQASDELALAYDKFAYWLCIFFHSSMFSENHIGKLELAIGELRAWCTRVRTYVVLPKKHNKNLRGTTCGLNLS